MGENLTVAAGDDKRAGAPGAGTMHRPSPEVTVLMPVRDGERWLPATLRSLHRLRGVDAEILVVDDGSRDGTPALLAAAAARDGRFRLVRRPSEGIVAALNAGLSAARAPYVARVDADDLVHPERLVHQLAAARAHGWDVVGSRVRCFPRTTLSKGLARYERWLNELLTHDAMARDRFIESPLAHPSVLFDRDRILALGGYRDRGWPEDYDLWLRLFAAGARFGKVDRVLTLWRDHPERVSRRAPWCSAEAFRACKAAHLLAGPLAGAPGFWIAGTGRDAKRLAPALVAGGARLRGWFDVHPRRLGQRILGAPVVRLGEARPAPGEVVLAAVGAEGRRPAIRSLLDDHGLVEMRDYWCVA